MSESYGWLHRSNSLSLDPSIYQHNYYYLPSHPSSPYLQHSSQCICSRNPPTHWTTSGVPSTMALPKSRMINMTIACYSSHHTLAYYHTIACISFFSKHTSSSSYIIIIHFIITWHGIFYLVAYNKNSSHRRDISMRRMTLT